MEGWGRRGDVMVWNLKPTLIGQLPWLERPEGQQLAGSCGSLIKTVMLRHIQSASSSLYIFYLLKEENKERKLYIIDRLAPPPFHREEKGVMREFYEFYDWRSGWIAGADGSHRRSCAGNSATKRLLRPHSNLGATKSPDPGGLFLTQLPLDIPGPSWSSCHLLSCNSRVLHDSSDAPKHKMHRN